MAAKERATRYWRPNEKVLPNRSKNKKRLPGRFFLLRIIRTTRKVYSSKHRDRTPRQMTVAQYYFHTRALAPFRAVDCLAMARQAVALDHAATLAALPPPGAASYEVDLTGGVAVRLSFSIKVF